MKNLMVLLGLFLSRSLMAEQILVVTDEWEGYTSNEGKGYYMELLQKIYTAPSYELKFLVVPYARSLGMFEGGKADIVLGINRGEIPDKHLAAYVVEQDLVDVLVSDETAMKWKGMQTLEGKIVLAKIGYAFDDITDVNINYSEKASLEGMIKMLSVGRAAGVLDYHSDLMPLLQKTGLDKKGYKVIKSVLSSPVYFGFADSAKGEALKAHFEKRFKEMYHAGEIKALMERTIGNTDGLTEQLQSWKKFSL